MSLAVEVVIERMCTGETRKLAASVHGNVVLVHWPLSSALEFDRRSGHAKNRLARAWRLSAEDVQRLATHRVHS